MSEETIGSVTSEEMMDELVALYTEPAKRKDEFTVAEYLDRANQTGDGEITHRQALSHLSRAERAGKLTSRKATVDGHQVKLFRKAEAKR